MSCELTLVIPTFNERGNIRFLVDSLKSVLQGYEWEVIFVDDDSPDGTANLVRQIAVNNPRVRCIQRLRRRGLASACIEGILASSSPYIAIMDADLQHDESILPEMLKVARENRTDLVIGSRYTSGGSAGELAPVRVWISRQATRISRMVLRRPVADPMSGFFLLRRTFFEKIMRNLSGKGFKILLDIIVTAGEDVKIMEIPYTMRKRVHGESKLDAKVVWEFFTLVAHKYTGRIVPYQFLSFATVGFTGIFVHLATLWFTYKHLGLEFIYSQITATLVAMTSNFILNNEFTFKENRLTGKLWLYGLLSFYAACTFGAIINVAVANLLFERSVHWWLSGTAGAVAGAVWNYAITATFTWKSNSTGSG